jgi:eukaryotic-like serine/threonine-protein kinase
MLGRSLGNYTVVSKIGEGGMGAVYLARHVTLGRPAAIKVLHPSLSSNQDMVSRFFNEARAATAVRNPGIVEVFDYGVLEDGSAYIVMEYLEGENLGARIRRGRMSVAATMTIIRAISRALQAAHEQGIVHRDLKPDNVFLVPDGELASGERVKLLDFGIAKLAPVSGEVSQTRTGMVMGTPTYMAPEQCRGAGSVDHRADLYALGCVAYHMMCGQPPFVSDGAGDLIARHLYFAPQPLRSLSPEIPADVDDLVLWLLQKDPAARPASATDVVRAIDRLAAASVAGVMQTQPPTRFSVPSIAPVAETTLRGAASAVALVDAPPRSRAPLVVGVGLGVVAVAAMLFITLRGDEADPASLAAAAAPGDRAPAPPAGDPPTTTPTAATPTAATPTAATPTAATPTAATPTAATPTAATPTTPPTATPTTAAPVATPPPAAATPPTAAPIVTSVPPASPAPTSDPTSPPAAVAVAATPAPTAAERSERGGRGDRKKRSSSSSRVAQNDPEPASAGAGEPRPPVPAPAPTPPVAQPPVTEPPPAQPPAAPKPAAVPAPPPATTPAVPREPPVVSAAAVSKRSGMIPALRVNGVAGDFADVVVKLCIDEQGAVSSVKVIKAPREITAELRSALHSWRYAPYVNAAGVQSAVCFPVSFRVVLKS